MHDLGAVTLRHSELECLKDGHQTFWSKKTQDNLNIGMPEFHISTKHNLLKISHCIFISDIIFVY